MGRRGVEDCNCTGKETVGGQAWVMLELPEVLARPISWRFRTPILGVWHAVSEERASTKAIRHPIPRPPAGAMLVLRLTFRSCPFSVAMVAFCVSRTPALPSAHSALVFHTSTSGVRPTCVEKAQGMEIDVRGSKRAALSCVY